MNNQTRHGTDYIGSSCNDGDMEETLVKKNVSCGSGHTCVTLQNWHSENLAGSAGNFKRLQICII